MRARERSSTTGGVGVASERRGSGQRQGSGGCAWSCTSKPGCHPKLTLSIKLDVHTIRVVDAAAAADAGRGRCRRRSAARQREQAACYNH